MSCTRVLHAFSHPQPAVAPAELAKCLNLDQSQYLCQLLSMSHIKPTQHYQPANYPQRTRLQSSRLSSSSSLSLPRGSPTLRSCFRKNSRSSMTKKRVVFADDKGFALTAVHLFTTEPPSSLFSDLVSGPPSPQLHKLQLGFPQPTQDIAAFLAHLKERKIQMESCSISKNILSGKVCVIHSANQPVYIRVTFDSWKSHKDILCTFFEHKRSLGLDINVFSFEIKLPQSINPNEQTEFCFLFEPGPGCAPLCDNNKGQNYRVCKEKDEASSCHGRIKSFYPELSKRWPLGLPPVSAYFRKAC